MIMKTKTICLIPARGGSKRIKNKNIKKFFGKPLLERVIKNAKKSKLFDNIYVSTDSALIKKLATSCGATVPYIRSKKLSNDHAIIKSVIDDFISKVISDIKQKINIFILYPTSVFVDKKLIIRCNQILQTTEYVTAVKKFPHPIERALKFNKNKLEPLNLKKKPPRVASNGSLTVPAGLQEQNITSQTGRPNNSMDMHVYSWISMDIH